MARRGLQRRLNFTLGALVLTVAAAVGASFALHERVHEASDDVRRAEAGMVAVLRLSIAVREAYAHQAHIVILNDRSHGDHYGDAVMTMTRSAQMGANAVAFHEEARAALAVVVEEARLLDEQFKREVLPRVGGDRALVVTPAEEAIFRVERMQKHIDDAASLLARDIDAGHARVAQATARSRNASVLMLLAAVLVAVFSALSLDRTLAAPLQRLEGATEALARGDLRARIAPQLADRPDELGSLARRFNTMAAALSEREGRLLEAERLAAVGRLAAGVAHEINNPLAVILGTARLLEKHEDDAGKRDIASIVAEVERCRAIVGGLLDLSRPQTLSTARVDLRALCDEATTRMRATSDATLVVHAVADPVVVADADKVRQVLMNLLLNATQAGARHVDITVDGAGPDDVCVAVADDGPGVSDSVARSLFEPFATGRAEGTGLGLAVSRSIAVAHGGRLEHARAERGARFTLTLPRTPHAGAAGSTT